MAHFFQLRFWWYLTTVKEFRYNADQKNLKTSDLEDRKTKPMSAINFKLTLDRLFCRKRKSTKKLWKTRMR